MIAPSEPVTVGRVAIMNVTLCGQLARDYCCSQEDVFAGSVRLDDYIPDLWYDAWKQMEPYITFSRHMPGYLECQVLSDEYW